MSEFNDNQWKMLSDIFRIMLHEITSEDDCKDLAPGEMGVDYGDGTLYIRNPHTGALFSPNNMKEINPVLEHMVPGRKYQSVKELNADLVNHISFYTNTVQLDKLGRSLWYTPDSLIRQMHKPAVFMGKIAIDEYRAYGWPSISCYCICFKTDEENVLIMCYDNLTHVLYSGNYDSAQHMFKGWINNTGIDANYCVATGDQNNIEIIIENIQVIKDLTSVMVNLPNGMNPNAKIMANNDGIWRDIVDTSGSPIGTEVGSNNSIMLIYDKVTGRWILLDPTENVTRVMLDIVQSRTYENASITSIESRLDEIESRLSALEA